MANSFKPNESDNEIEELLYNVYQEHLKNSRYWIGFDRFFFLMRNK